jgi:hypothetical protein
MDIEVKMLIDKDIYGLFQLVLKKCNHNEKDTIENYLLLYMTQQMEKDKKMRLQLETEKKTDKLPQASDNVNYGKANDRIPNWAYKPNQYNHKIIRAYFRLLKNASSVTLYNLELLCTDKTKPEFYVPTFRSNYASMKLDNGNSHGKVFEDDGKIVWIWPEVEATLMKYKQYFE